jgi:hypothetical protein
VDYDPLDTINKFMKFIRNEQNKINPPPKEVKPRKRPAELPDDSLSEITDIEKEEIMQKYYVSKLDRIAKRKAERLQSQKRLQGAHQCKPMNIKRAKLAINDRSDRVELQLRQPNEPKCMIDEEMSAHQFSNREKSIQADSEERMDADMISQMEMSPGRVDSRSRSRTHTVKSVNLSRNVSTTSVGKVSKKLKQKDSLFGAPKARLEMAVQTDGEGSQERILKSRGGRRAVKVEGSDDGSMGKAAIEPDIYKEDWVTSLCYKKAMKAEAIKRGKPVDSDFEVDEEEERVAMTITNFDGQTIMGYDGNVNQESGTEFNANQF